MEAGEVSGKTTTISQQSVSASATVHYVILLMFDSLEEPSEKLDRKPGTTSQDATPQLPTARHVKPRGITQSR